MKKIKKFNILIFICISLSLIILLTACTNKQSTSTSTSETETTTIAESTSIPNSQNANSFVKTNIKNADDFKNVFSDVKITELSDGTEYSANGKFYKLDGKYIYNTNAGLPLMFQYDFPIEFHSSEEMPLYETDEDKKHNAVFADNVIETINTFKKENKTDGVTIYTYNGDTVLETKTEFSDEDIRQWTSDIITAKNGLSKVEFLFSCGDYNIVFVINGTYVHTISFIVFSA